jgi:hypothetical protein
MKKGAVMGNKIIYQRNEILSAIIFKCLWNEPHQLKEILEKLESEFSVDADSLDEFLKCTSQMLGEATKAGLIRRTSNFYILTPEGRRKTEVDGYSVFKSIPPSFLESAFV